MCGETSRANVSGVAGAGNVEGTRDLRDDGLGELEVGMELSDSVLEERSHL